MTVLPRSRSSASKTRELGCFGQTLRTLGGGLAASAMPPPKSPQPTLCLDSGGVLTVQRSGGEKHDGDTIWKATMPGAYALVQLFQYHHGPDSVCVVSRVNRIPADSARHRHWVERHAVSVGVLWRRVYLCIELEEKRKHVREAKTTASTRSTP